MINLWHKLTSWGRILCIRIVQFFSWVFRSVNKDHLCTERTSYIMIVLHHRTSDASENNLHSWSGWWFFNILPCSFLWQGCVCVVLCFFFWGGGGEGPRSRCYGHAAALRLIVQPCGEDSPPPLLLPCNGAWEHGKTEVLWGGGGACQWHFVYHKSHMDWPGIEPGPLPWGIIFCDVFYFKRIERKAKLTIWDDTFQICSLSNVDCWPGFARC
jgi:hypothetical protein